MTEASEKRNVTYRRTYSQSGGENQRKPQTARILPLLSIGAAMFNGHPDYERLIQIADEALYIAKDEAETGVELWKASLYMCATGTGNHEGTDAA
ncbi:hypothetical protein ACLK1T_27730 [Escherichia coli]